MKRPCNSRNAVIPVLLWGLVVCLRPADASARTISPKGPPFTIDEPDLLEARSDTGYVDMGSNAEGDRFVDEDGDGLDDRQMERHRKRGRHRGQDDQRGGVGPEEADGGSVGRQGPGGGGPGAGPGRGGR
jgi:hypothetical protein